MYTHIRLILMYLNVCIYTAAHSNVHTLIDKRQFGFIYPTQCLYSVGYNVIGRSYVAHSQATVLLYL